jgi:hypothetical protein
MRKGFLSTVVSLLAGAGFAVAEPPSVSRTPKPMEPAAAAAPAAADAGAASLTTSDCTSGNACNACDGCDGCNQCGGRVWADADFLLWWIRDSHTPALVTTGSTANAFPGALGQSGTRTLFGGDIDNDTRAGARFDVGTWLNDDDTLGVGADFLFLGHRSVNFNAFSLGSPILARPFLNASLGSERAFLIAFPNSQAGAVNASLSSRLWGGELDARAEVAHNETGRVDVLAGFRHLELIENLDIANATLFTAPNPVFGGLNIQSVDHFGAGNFFYGGEIGADSVFENGPLSLRLLGKVAFGNMHEIVNVSRHIDHDLDRRNVQHPHRPAGAADQHRPLHEGRARGRSGTGRDARLCVGAKRPRHGRLHVPLRQRRSAARRSSGSLGERDANPAAHRGGDSHRSGPPGVRVQ